MSTLVHLSHRPRLAITIAFGVAVGMLLPSDWSLISRLLTAWNVGAWSYLASIAWLVVFGSHEKMKALSAREDHSAVAVLATLSCAAVLSLAAIVMLLADTKQLPLDEKLLHYAFTAVTLIGSWLLVGVLFTLHYAHLFYRAEQNDRPLSFPDHKKNPDPDYWDFLYFSFTIAVAAQTSDVCVQSRPMRKAVLAQSVLSFLFNAAILGLSVNIAAGLVSG